MSSDNYTTASNHDLNGSDNSQSQHIVKDGHELTQIETATSETRRNALKVVHTDGTINYVDNKAVGGDSAEMPEGYFRSVQFIGTVVVSGNCLARYIISRVYLTNLGLCRLSVSQTMLLIWVGYYLPTPCEYFALQVHTYLTISQTNQSSTASTLINADLGNSADINWVATVWTLGTSIGFLLVGRISDIFGRRDMVLCTGVLALIGCIIGSCAQSVNMLIAANICTGIAAAGQLSFGIVLGELVPNRMRGPIVTLVFMSSAPFAIFGPIIARLFIENTSSRWRWSYYLGDIFSVLALALYYFLYHPPTYDQLHVNGKTKMQQLKELDYLGMFLFVAGVVLFLVGLSVSKISVPLFKYQRLTKHAVGRCHLSLGKRADPLHPALRHIHSGIICLLWYGSITPAMLWCPF